MAIDLIDEDVHNVRSKRPNIERAKADLGHDPDDRAGGRRAGHPRLDASEGPGVSVAVRRAIYGKLAGDSTLTALLEPSPPAGYSKSIYHQQAPQGAGFPYVVFNQQSANPMYSFASLAMDQDLWLIKGVDRNPSSDKADGIADRLDALLTDGTISISGKTQLYLRREGLMSYPETEDGVLYRHSGHLFRLIYT